MHEFMIFAGGDLPQREGCIKVLAALAGSSGTGYAKAAQLGCLGYEQWSQTTGQVIKKLTEELSTLSRIYLSITLREDDKPVEKKVTISLVNAQQSRKHKRSQRTHGLSSGARGLIGAITKYISHTVIKYTSKDGPNFMQDVKASWRRHAPMLTAEQLSNEYWHQLKEQGLTSPLDPERCSNKGGEYECDDWNATVPGYWVEARIEGPTL